MSDADIIYILKQEWTVAKCEHGRGLDGRTVARGRHRREVVQARLGRRRGGQTGKPTDGPNRDFGS